MGLETRLGSRGPHSGGPRLSTPRGLGRNSEVRAPPARSPACDGGCGRLPRAGRLTGRLPGLWSGAGRRGGGQVWRWGRGGAPGEHGPAAADADADVATRSAWARHEGASGASVSGRGTPPSSSEARGRRRRTVVVRVPSETSATVAAADEVQGEAWGGWRGFGLYRRRGGG